MTIALLLGSALGACTTSEGSVLARRLDSGSGVDASELDAPVANDAGLPLPNDLAIRIGSTGNDDLTGLGVDGLGNVFVSGNFRGDLTINGTPQTLTGSAGLFVASYSPTGEARWARTFVGTDLIDTRTMAVRADGFHVVGGYFAGEATFRGTVRSESGQDGLLLALDGAGEIVWEQFLSGDHNCQFKTVSFSLDGATVLAGGLCWSVVPARLGDLTLQSSTYDAPFLAELDAATGRTLSVRVFSTGSHGSIQEVRSTSAGIGVVGYFQSNIDLNGDGGADESSQAGRDGMLITMEGLGASSRGLTFGSLGEDQGSDLDFLDGWFIGVGWTEGPALGSLVTSAGASSGEDLGGGDAFVFGWNTATDETFARAIGGAGLDRGHAIEIEEGKVFVGGTYERGSSESRIPESRGGQDGFVLRLSSRGSPEGALTVGGPGNDVVSRLAFAAPDELLIGGTFDGEITLAGAPYVSVGGRDLFVLRSPPP